jgi:hypothetical protein
MEEVERRGVRWEVTLEGRDVQRLDEPAEASPARATDA